MLFKLVTILTLVVPFISALTLNTPENLSSGGSATITWTNEAGDPSTFSLELINTAFNKAYAIANNVPPSSGTITLALPAVPPSDGYTLQAVNIGDISDVYSTSGSFSIAAQSTSTTTLSSSGSSASSTSSISYAHPASASGFGTTNTSPATTVSATSLSATGSTTKTSSSGSSSPTSSTFNSASPMKFGVNTGSIVITLLSAVAGAVVIAL